jgi:hypothetical protein
MNIGILISNSKKDKKPFVNLAVEFAKASLVLSIKIIT